MTTTLPQPDPSSEESSLDAEQYLKELIRYYSEAGPDYAAWSKGFNMHFGFFRRGMNPFRLEPMLERMNLEILDRLALSNEAAPHLLDMGCGLGATARVAARRFPEARVTGISIVPWQIESARKLTREAGLEERVHFVRADYRATQFPSQSFEGAYALESACYAEGLSKEPLLRETWRVLKPGGRLVVADGFLKHDRKLNPLLAYCLRTISRCWSLDTFAGLQPFQACLRELGFRNIQVEEISWNIAPSVLHVPLVTARFLWRELLFSKQKMTKKRWDNVLAPTLGMVVGLARRTYGYYLISAQR